MALEGYLEDLGISEILQIVSLSKKSGTLTLIGTECRGAISFVDGQVVRAASSDHPDALGELMCHHGLVTRQQVAAALAKQQEQPERQPLGTILANEYQVDQKQIEERL